MPRGERVLYQKIGGAGQEVIVVFERTDIQRMNWQAAGQAWLIRAAHVEWIAQGRPNGKRNRRYVPPDWQRDAVAALGRNDEELFKAIKLGYISLGGTT